MNVFMIGEVLSIGYGFTVVHRTATIATTMFGLDLSTLQRVHDLQHTAGANAVIKHCAHDSHELRVVLLLLEEHPTLAGLAYASFSAAAKILQECQAHAPNPFAVNALAFTALLSQPASSGEVEP